MKKIEEKPFQAGRNEKGDVFLEFYPQTSGGLQLDLESSVMALYGEQIKQTTLEMLHSGGVQHARLRMKDNGALDFVIKARLEAVMREAGYQCESVVLPLSKKGAIKDRLRRTRLYLPGNNPDLMINAGLFAADCIILDLEDSVAPTEKAAARILVRNALAQLDFGASERIVRINPLTSPYGRSDLEMIVPALPDTLLIPKCETAENLREIECLVQAIEEKAHISEPIFFMPLIETAKGILHAYEIATATPRNVALCFGAEDFTADLGVERTKDGRESFVARSLIVLAAKAAGIQAMDTVFSDVQDINGLIASTQEAMALGFDGKGVIHPAQIKPIHQVYCPTPEQIEKAQEIIKALQEAEAKGSGVASLGAKMIDAPVAARAEKILLRARALGLI